ncbi:uncharacterized protein Z519_05465 [Cladophialophora bantiana CBS 173.52]|uniref:RING-14 protein n=1 Tax=Cladophialophora bantiana (strain ATCC 10958 / CBS 173.52 / CDC B-1940 / NIH 8579) TaxID=1442370 RepID=A0A0D2IBE8_CLAB1|nr:uncharacterized protein Z519_05465 [Cladophialophora bantiana CBS 173.52]KIW94149.1 hypothetical protein Z519_05465 [Cladophialophora bantiana CBS 173.52]
MKFRHIYKAALDSGEYPQDWVSHAISYCTLKMCIERVERELSTIVLENLSLDAPCEQTHLDPAEFRGKISRERFQSSLSDFDTISVPTQFAMVSIPGESIRSEMWLSLPETKIMSRYVEQSANVEEPHRPEVSSDERTWRSNKPGLENGELCQQGDVIAALLAATSEIFQVLQRDLTGLDKLYQSVGTHLQDEIVQLGNGLRSLCKSKSRRSRREIKTWRKIFELYSEAEVFFSSHGANAGTRDAGHAQKQFQRFTWSLAAEPDQLLKFGTQSLSFLGRFIRINEDLLRIKKFQELSRTALANIIKKFKKRLPLHAHLASSLTASLFIEQDLATALSFIISKEVLSAIPQLSDYLCPICFSISYKPVRLRCRHLFCIRCMVVLQRQGRDPCPLCREDVVLEATSDNIDEELRKFMEANFKAEVAEKQRQNEVAAGIDRWGAAYEQSQKCVIM